MLLVTHAIRDYYKHARVALGESSARSVANKVAQRTGNSKLASQRADRYNGHHQTGEADLACPFFMPLQKLDGAWLHPSRLPLGGGWDGHCSAPGHEGTQPSRDELHEFCNLGYAAKCLRLPVDREWDAVRFSVARDQGSRLLLWFVCETGHLPAQYGTLEYDVDRNRWMSSHSDLRIQKMLECYVQAYLQRRMQCPTTASIVSKTS